MTKGQSVEAPVRTFEELVDALPDPETLTEEDVMEGYSALPTRIVDEPEKKLTGRDLPKLVVSDMDGVLSDDTDRVVKYILGQPWSTVKRSQGDVSPNKIDPSVVSDFFREAQLDKPMQLGIDLVGGLCRSNKCKLTILSARPDWLAELTVVQLMRWGLDEFLERVVVKPASAVGNVLEWKKTELIKIAHEYDIVVYVENNLFIVETCEGLGIPLILLAPKGKIWRY